MTTGAGRVDRRAKGGVRTLFLDLLRNERTVMPEQIKVDWNQRMEEALTTPD
jgi:hypothetical protein